MNHRLLPVLGLALLLTASSRAQPPLPAFPGAEGFGTQTGGGRGGQVLFVENLNEDGPGSLRVALSSKGPRTVIFRTGGTIVLDEGINISEPYLTVAGQTAPGDGICLKAGPRLASALITVKTHDVILRGLRFRCGDAGKSPVGDNRDNLAIGTSANYDEELGYGRAHDIVVDHCSMSWSIDENVQFWYHNRSVTIQNCLIAEGLHYSIHPKSQNPPQVKGLTKPQSHSFGLLIGGGGTKQVTLHHNLFAHNYGRNPRIDGNCSVEMLNNVVHDWGFRAVDLVGDTPAPTFLNIIGNYFSPTKPSSFGGASVYVTAGKTPYGDGSGIYLSGNLDGVRTSAEQDAWASAIGWDDLAAMKAKYGKDEPAFPPSGVALDADAKAAYEKVLANAGAVPRDAVDARIVGEVRDGTAHFINSPSEVGGWPEYDLGMPPADSDRDGMPDAWEQEHGLNPEVYDAAGSQLSKEGYSNLEVYLNGLMP